MDPVELFDNLGEKYSPDILRSAAEAKSAQELSEELDIPVTTSYRRVETLAETGLLEARENDVGETGRGRTVYRRNVDEIVIRFEGEELEVESKERETPERGLAGVWDDLGRGRGLGGDD